MFTVVVLFYMFPIHMTCLINGKGYTLWFRLTEAKSSWESMEKAEPTVSKCVYFIPVTKVVGRNIIVDICISL